MPIRTLSIVVPIFNEERRLPTLLERLQDADAAAARAGLQLRQVLLVDDGSTDKSGTILSEANDLDGRFEIITSALPNRGKGAAVRTGMLRAHGDVGLMTDVDLSTPLDELAALMAAISSGADIAIASRGLEGSRILVHQPRHRELMGKTFNLLIRSVTDLPFRDTQCGFKLFRLASTRRLFELQRIDGFAFDLELLVTARRLGLDVREIPVQWVDDPDTHVGLFSSSAAMALDTIRIAYRSRQPLTEPEPDSESAT